jgi:hypothetical protein
MPAVPAGQTFVDCARTDFINEADRNAEKNSPEPLSAPVIKGAILDGIGRSQ